MASEESIQFPKKLLLGTGSSAYQIEGGWDADGKSANIWDDYFHKPAATGDIAQENGDVACDSYHKLDEDVQNLIDLGVDIYRFSISWTRVLPKADDRFPNEAGVNYYKKLIQKLLDNNIQPMITIHHFDLPKILQNLGGWTNPHIIGYFSNYAAFLFRTYGGQVKLWSTINEPRLVAMGYGTDKGFAPAIGTEFNGFAEYMVTRNLLLAHAAAYRIYDESFRSEQRGEISLCLDTAAYFPKDPDLEEHRKAESRAYDFYMGMFIRPLVDGVYPDSVSEAVRETSARENVSAGRLLEFTEQEKETLAGSFDFIAINYYDSYKVTPMSEEEYGKTESLYQKDTGFLSTLNEDDWNETITGFTQVIDWIGKTYNNPKLFIAENGVFEKPNEPDSSKKVKYHHGILTELDKALKKGVDIKGYCVWSFMDSLEWNSGYYSKIFGIYSVDFNDPNRPRAKKTSTEFFEKLFKTKTLPPVI